MSVRSRQRRHGTPIAVDVTPSATGGITSSSIANPTNILCDAPHGLTTGEEVVIAGHAGSTPSLDGHEVVTVVDADNFTVDVNVTTGDTGGTFSSPAMTDPDTLQMVAAFTNIHGAVVSPGAEVGAWDSDPPADATIDAVTGIATTVQAGTSDLNFTTVRGGIGQAGITDPVPAALTIA